MKFPKVLEDFGYLKTTWAVVPQMYYFVAESCNYFHHFGWLGGAPKYKQIEVCPSVSLLRTGFFLPLLFS